MRKSQEEGDVFFDSHENMRASVDSLSSYFSLEEQLETNHSLFEPQFWTDHIASVSERRKKFLRETGFDEFVSCRSGGSFESMVPSIDHSAERIDMQRLTETTDANINNFSIYDGVKCSNFCQCGDADIGTKLTGHKAGDNGITGMIKKVILGKVFTLGDLEKLLRLSFSVFKFIPKELPFGEKCGDCSSAKGFEHSSWWRRLISKVKVACLCWSCFSITHSHMQRSITKVLQHKKRYRELSALFTGQEILAHKGLIRTMKFSASGCYIATGGEDCVVRIWQIEEVETFSKCFTSKTSKHFTDEIKGRKSIFRRKGTKFVPIVIPKKVFRIMEAPLQELHGHAGEILDMSWAESDCLITSSMDKTARLWKVGCDGCIQIFQHNDYVTCIQFNPIDERYFISGSIDGKIRVWDISENHVVDWIDIRDIVTAICYRPDGKGFVVGSINGNCRFYDYLGNIIQLKTQICIEGKRKCAGKRITGLQFSPEDPEKIMITSADSSVRIFDGFNVVQKFKGLRKTRSHLSASFTSDGQHIVSVGENSNIYLWNSNMSSKSSAKPTKSIRSFELFSSKGVLVAVPWTKTDSKGPTTNWCIPSPPFRILEPSTCLRDPECFYLGSWLFSDCISRVEPEEKLLASSKTPSKLDNHHVGSQGHGLFHHHRHLASLAATWSMVIVTASCDGRIRSFHNYGLPVLL